MENAQATSMAKVWKFVLATMLGTALIGYAWQSIAMAHVRAAHEAEESAVRANIAKLTAYRDTLNAVRATSTLSPPL